MCESYEKGWEFLLMEMSRFATAYAVTKALLPLRLIVSVWGTPWFARVSVIPALGVVRRMFGKGSANGKPTASSPPVSKSAGTGSTVSKTAPKDTPSGG